MCYNVFTTERYDPEIYMKKNFLEKINSSGKISLPQICLSALSGWLFSLFIFATLNPYNFTSVPKFTKVMPTAIFLLSALLLGAAVYFLDRYLWNKAVPVALLASFSLYAIASIANSSRDSNVRAYTALVFILLALAALALVMNYLKRENIELGAKDISPMASFIIVSIAFVALSAYFICVLGARTACYCSPCYDMGIFAQMYDNMTETLLPYTTCERGTYLSHFDVHFSPILYLLLPFCYIFKVTDVLVWAQILVVFSGVFPLLLICRRCGLSNIKSTLICLVFLFYPAMSSGAFYDFHENAFLAPLILWTLYFVHIEKWIPAFIFALGVLAVKEDAALYVAFIALFVIFSRKKLWQGLALFAMTVAYFFFATYMLMQGSEGIMLGGRYYNIIGESGGFVDLIRVALVNPALYAAESFTPEKLLYSLNMLLPVALLPLMTRKPSRWLLIAPLFVMNLISDYQYQYNLTFQYSFGSGALLVYAAAINLADMSDSTFSSVSLPEGEDENCRCDLSFKKFSAGASAALLSVALTASIFLSAARAPSEFFYVGRYFAEAQTFDTVEDVLSRVDRSKSVMATSMYLTHLYDVDELYHTSQATREKMSLAGDEVVGYAIVIETDIVVLDLRPYVSDSEDAELWKNAYLSAGYEIVEEHPDIILVMEKG